MWCLTFLIVAAAAAAESSRPDGGVREPLVLSTTSGSVLFSADHGGIVAVRQRGREGSILRSGERGLWQVRFRDGSTIDAAGFAAGTRERAFSYEADPAARRLRLHYRSAALVVTVVATAGEDGVDMVGEVRPLEKTVLDFALPARLRFDPAQAERVVCPADGNQSVGTAFRRAFFERQPEDHAAAWHGQSVGPQGYVGLYGGHLNMRPMDDPPVPLRVTATGREWFGDDAARRWEGTRATVNRPPRRAQADLVLVDSDNGAYFSASRLGGTGALWRIGGFVGENEAPLSRKLVAATIRKLVAVAAAPRRKLGVLAVTHGPERGAGSHVAVGDWGDEVRRGAPAAESPAPLVELTNVRELSAALAADDFLAILNPYGEWLPAGDADGLPAMVAAVGRFVRSGGHWLEVGGHPFFGVLTPVRYFAFHVNYPPAFADFLHLETHAGAAAVFGVQPQTAPPWAGATDHAAIFVPGRLGCGGDDRGGYGDRAFGTFVRPGETWRSPASRLVVGRSAADALRNYCTRNAITRRLDEKLPPALLARFRQAVLVYYAGNCAEKLAHVDKLPVPTLVHFADYLKGGFDKEYPDHLPPRPEFGSAAELRRFFDRCHALGHLVMPYTNPTWWCDHPRGPSFERAGETPLLRTLDGKLSYERYAANDGYTVCHWHPAVQQANRETMRQFIEDFPVDVLFQDQCGARTWRYDTNPASPTAYAYADGLVSMVAEDSARKPLSTESGWDRVVNYESHLCGLSWQLVPTEGGPAWRRFLKHEYPPQTWEVFPVAQYIAHDKTAMLYHDLGQFVTTPELVAWTLGLGFGMSYRCSAAALKQDAPREWLRWLDRLQKSVCARYIGQPLQSFAHDRGPQPSVADDGLLRATYSSAGGDLPAAPRPASSLESSLQAAETSRQAAKKQAEAWTPTVAVVANLGSEIRVDQGHQLAAYGFYVTAPGLVAGRLKRVGGTDFGDDGVSFVVEGDRRRADVWVYAPAERDVAVELPPGMTGDVTVALDGAEPMAVRTTDGGASFRLPSRPGRKRATVPAGLAGKAPRDRTGGKPAIGILDFADGPRPTWTRIQPDDWVAALQQSALVRVHGLAVKRITTLPELTAALPAGPTAWLAIVNPYGEGLPTAGRGRWREMLAQIRNYVNQGGCWWETGGYSFHQTWAWEDGRWQSEPIGPRGMAELGLPVGGGEIDAPAEPLRVTRTGRRWLGAELSAQVERRRSAVNRGLPRSQEDPGHVTLVTGTDQDFIGGYRLDGWGWLWRIGGFWPDPEVALPVAMAVLEYLYSHPPEPVAAGGVHYLWHATVR